MNKLDEIIEAKRQEWLINGYGARQLAKMVALEFAKHILKEAAENAETQWNGDYIEIPVDTVTVNKKSITDTLNKYL